MRQTPWTMVRWSVKQRGLGGTLRVVGGRLRGFVARGSNAAVHPFDARCGTDTGGLIGGGKLATGRRNDRYITAYAGVAPSRLVEVLRRWMELEQVSLEDFAFVDVGCGKGRALLLASEYPFARVVGVEINEGLAAVAQRNVEIWRTAGLGVSTPEVEVADVTEWTLPAGDCFLFLYNPFSAEVTRAFLDVVARQKAASRDAVYLLYQNESEATPLREDGRLRLLWTGSIAMSDEDKGAELVGSPDDVTSLYRWVGR